VVCLDAQARARPITAARPFPHPHSTRCKPRRALERRVKGRNSVCLGTPRNAPRYVPRSGDMEAVFAWTASQRALLMSRKMFNAKR
jgi:hypothetical protein